NVAFNFLASPQQSTPQASSTTTGVTYGSSVPSRGGVPTPPSSHLSAMNQPNPPNVTITTKTTQSQQLTTQHVDNINRPTRGQSPVPLGSRIWNQATNPSSPVSTPPTTSVLANQLSVAPGIANVGHPSQQNVQLSTLVSQSQSGFVTSQPAMMSTQSGNVRTGLPSVTLRMANPSPVTTMAGVGNTNNLTVQIGQIPSFTQQQNQQQQTTIATSIPQQTLSVSMPSKVVNVAGSLVTSQAIVPIAASVSSTVQASHTVPGALHSAIAGQAGRPQTQSGMMVAMSKERMQIWQGFIEFQEKGLSSGGSASRVCHNLRGTISCNVVNGEPEVNADKWPNKVAMQLLPRHLISTPNVTAILKNAARHIYVHFPQDTEAVQKLTKFMSSNWIGCIQFTPPNELRIMLILYMTDKQIYIGAIPNDQDGFLAVIRQIFESYRKQQAAKQQKMLTQLSGGGTIPGSSTIGLSTTNASPQTLIMNQANPANIVTSTQLGARPMMQGPAQRAVVQTNQQQQQQQNQGQATVVAPLNQQTSLSQQQRLSQLEAERQQNLLKIQQLQQTLEAAQQKELQYKAAQEQQQQQQQQQQQALIERHNLQQVFIFKILNHYIINLN
ncbi:mediator of RNA polymerase II transcription subunit 25-like, partial [Centruroides sculpturatus]|uniref:mediator of RNA polymerase II transcription subunit 25-like n=1 Tax=Centruroides sculpturatus TaxID=218467 RepID=UPI000C6ED147